MKKIVCMISEGLSKTNEQYILQYDKEDVQIEIFTDIFSMGLSVGTIRTLLDKMYTSEQDKFYFCTNLRQLYVIVKDMYADIFEAVMLCPEVDEESYDLCSIYAIPVSRTIKELQNRISDLKLYFLYHGQDKDLWETVETYWEDMNMRIAKLADSDKKILYRWLEEYSLVIDDNDRLFYIYCLSILLNALKEERHVVALYNEVHEAFYSVDQCFFVFHQLKRYFLLNSDASGREWMNQLYEEIETAWIENCEELCESIPVEKRNINRVAIIILQFLGRTHAPTKTALERIETLNKKMGKEVLVIHSAEQLSKCGEMPFYKGMIGNIDHRLDGFNRVEGKNGHTFPMYQPKTIMPDYLEIKKILDMLREFAPHKLIVLGDHCLLGDLAARMIPTVCIPMTFSTIPKKQNQFVAVGKHLTEDDYTNIKAMGCEPERYIESTFTFDVIEQTTKLSRAELGIPEDKFVLSVVGIRLDHEVTESFIRGLQKVFEHGCHIAFAGKFEEYGDLCKRVPELAAHSTFVGYQDDILAFEEVCDLYVNPPRVGGGFSVVEAFCKGKPAVTLPYGDVAASAGPEFWVESPEKMEMTILRYKNDAAFYQKQAERAIKRSAELFDSVGALQHILDEMEKREGFF